MCAPDNWHHLVSRNLVFLCGHDAGKLSNRLRNVQTLTKQTLLHQQRVTDLGGLIWVCFYLSRAWQHAPQNRSATSPNQQDSNDNANLTARCPNILARPQNGNNDGITKACLCHVHLFKCIFEHAIDTIWLLLAALLSFFDSKPCWSAFV